MRSLHRNVMEAVRAGRRTTFSGPVVWTRTSSPGTRRLANGLPQQAHQGVQHHPHPASLKSRRSSSGLQKRGIRVQDDRMDVYLKRERAVRVFPKKIPCSLFCIPCSSEQGSPPSYEGLKTVRYVIADQFVRQAARPVLDTDIAARLHNAHSSTVPLTAVLQ